MQPDGKGRNRQASPRIGSLLNNMGTASYQQRQWWPASALGMAAVGRCPSSAAAVPGSPKATYSPLAYAKRQRATSSEPKDVEEDAEEDGLSDLLNLALSKTSSSEADAAVNNTNMDIIMELGKSETSESITLTNLLSTLHGSKHVGLQPQAQSLACTDLLASGGLGMGVGGFGIRLPGNIVPQPFIVAPDSESIDVPLVSTRAAGAGTPDTADVVISEAPVVTSHLIDYSIMQQQQAGSPVLVGVSGVGVVSGAAGSGGGGVVSMLAGVRSSSPLSCFRPHPAWPAEAGRLLFVAVFLTQESRDVLLAMVPPLHPLVTADHMTLAYKPLSVQQLLAFPLGASVQLNITGTAADSRAQAVAADPAPWLSPMASVSTHVTISMAVGAKPAEAGDLLRDALQLAATADPAGPVVSGAGTYQHLQEPLPLVGRLGVKVELPSGQTLVVHTVDELAAGGHVSLCSDDIDTFYNMHSERVKRPLQQQPSPASCLDLPSVTVSASSSNSSGDGTAAAPYSPLTAATSEDMPPLQLPPALHLPPALISAPKDATNSNSCWSPGSAAANAAGSTEQQPAVLVAGPCAGDSAEQLLNNSTADDDTSSSSGSDSDTDAVQFRSAVQVGDYVALRPFVPTESGIWLLQGYVREFACDEAFQGNGVMVVLSDNTIGFVVAVLDSAGSSSGAGAGSSKRAAPQQPMTSKPNKRKQRAAHKKAAARGGNLAALDAAASDAAEVLSEWVMSQNDSAQGGVAATAAAGLGVRNAADAARDMQLWAEFDALQRQLGEGLCSAILHSCDHDFVEAVATIKAQAAGFGGGSSSAAGASASAPAVAALSVQPPAAAAAAHEPDDDLVVQLALSLGLPAESALALCRLVPHVAPEAAVEALQQHSGDANKAADALLAAEAEAASAAAAAAIAAADERAAAALESASEPAAYGSGSGGGLSPAERVAASFARARDPDLVVSARSLCGMFDGLQQELAELVLQEHGGSIEQAASAISDMQAKELQARSTASAAGEAGSPSRLQQSDANKQQLSEEDQYAMLAAMGLYDSAEQQQQQQAKRNAGVSPAKRQQRSPPKTPQPRSPLLAPTQHQQTHYNQPSSRPSSSNAASSYSPLGVTNRQPPPPPPQQQQGTYGSPPGRYSSMQRQQQQQSMVGSHANQEAKLSAKAAADKLYTKSRTLNQGAIVLMTAAQAMLADDNDEGYREQKAAADRLRAESRAAFDEAQRLSWSANNTAQQTWQVDLHGLATSVALRKFVIQFSGLEAMASGHPGGVLYQVITGKGKHSDNNVPKIKLGVLQYLEERGEAVMQETGQRWAVSWQVDPCNEGVVNVHIPGCSEEEGEEGGSSA